MSMSDIILVGALIGCVWMFMNQHKKEKAKKVYRPTRLPQPPPRPRTPVNY